MITADRQVAFEVLRRTFEDGAFTDRALAALAPRRGLEGSELGRARRLAYGSVQRRGTSDELIARFSRRSLARIDPAALAALRLGIFELLHSDDPAAHAAVDQAVELAKVGMRGDGCPPARVQAGGGFVNALLRRVAGEREAILASFDDETPAGAATAHSYPAWLAEMWFSELGAAEARLLMAAMNEPAETAVRVNSLRGTRAAVAEELRRAGVRVEVPGPEAELVGLADALVVDRASEPVSARIATGELVPQSRGSQAAVALLGPRPGERVLDLCAGPGIKTTQIAAAMGNSGEIRSIELDPRRAEEIREACERAGVTCARVEVADAAEADLGAGYDRILVDAPCSDLGTLASRPDARWRKQPETIERLVQLQRRILVRAARALAPGGALVYSTCTISRRENEALAAELEARAPVRAESLGERFGRLASREDTRFLQLLPQRDRTTGFFFARYLEGSDGASDG